MTLDDGTTIDRDMFGRIYGGGQKAAKNRPLKVLVGTEQIIFSAGNLEPVQTILNLLVEDNEKLRAELEDIKNSMRHLKPRIRVPAGRQVFARAA